MKATIAAATLFAVSCTTVTATTPDGTATTVKAPVPGLLSFAKDVFRAYSPRPIPRVREEKSGPIKPSEIQSRWKP